MPARRLALGVMAIGLFALAARAKTGLDIVAEFGPKNAQAAVASYTDEKGKRIGLLGISADKRNSITFRLDEWNVLIGLVDKAAAAQGGDWKQTGEFTETNTEDISHLVIEAGPGIQLTVSSPKGPKLVARIAP